MGDISASIIIPVYNSVSYLEQCLESVLQQTRDDFEVICVDNGSSDDSIDILESFAARDGRVSVLHEPAPGVSCARNTGIAHARGRYLMFADSDDTVDMRFVEVAVGAAERHDAQIVSFTFDECFEEPIAYFPHPLCPLPGVYGRPLSIREASFPLCIATTPCVWRHVFKTSYVSEHDIVFPANLRTSEDLVFVYLSLLSAERIVLLPDMLYHYRRDRRESLTRKDRKAAGIVALRSIYDAMLPVHGEDWFDLQMTNLVLSTFEYQMRTCATSDEYRKLFQGYQDEWATYVDEHSDCVDARFERFLSRMSDPDPLENLFSQHVDAESYAEFVRVWDQAHKQELTTCHERIGRLEEELAAERARAEALRAELDGVYGSRSWKVARAVAGLARGRGRE